MHNTSPGTHSLTGYAQHFSWEDKGSERVYQAVLIISRVSHQDLQTHFRCLADNLVEWNSVIITLKVEESLPSVVLVCVCVLLFLLLVAMAVKWFAIDVALLFRRARRIEGKTLCVCVCCVCVCVSDGKVYDAYVVYPRECVCENALSVFLSFTLPAVLEDQCGYKLFIHGRDDLPGEDQAEQVERCMRLSRRLLVVMTAVGSCGGKGVAPPLEEFDWQMGVHSALVQETISVIVVQVGDGHTHTQSQNLTHTQLRTHTQSDTHTQSESLSHTQPPPGLQLLLRKSAPIRWELGARGANSPTSRIWKRVRYMMPPPPPSPPHTRGQRLNTIQLI
ncbi:interleukin-1 receptor type 1-like [Clupea harengus]|uniref:Interleukin-1 receptor type 1-like n=1 Tax=Clupea harengus TaxID=7950 RepID=A0A8M1KDJ2_CLUHA|nr:interleukin-1 receptor type 1-like [Clupea harengus]